MVANQFWLRKNSFRCGEYFIVCPVYTELDAYIEGDSGVTRLALTGQNKSCASTATQTPASADSKSKIKSSISSMPTEMRTKPSLMPSA